LLERVGLHVLHESVRHRHSGSGNFVSVTVSFRCDSREQYEAAHHALRADPDIRYTM
jgi:putative lipoic acid-binding regulatory protein